jgi:hypothetical protein
MKSKLKSKRDKFGRIWDLPKNELCPECGQPDSCGDCNHTKLRKIDVDFMQGKITEKRFLEKDGYHYEKMAIVRDRL